MYNPFDMGYCNSQVAFPISIRNFCREVQNTKDIHCHHACKEFDTMYHKHVFTVFFNHPKNMLFRYGSDKKMEECLGLDIVKLIIVEDVKTTISRKYGGTITKTEHCAKFAIQNKENNPKIYDGIIENVIILEEV